MPAVRTYEYTAFGWCDPRAVWSGGGTQGFAFRDNGSVPKSGVAFHELGGKIVCLERYRYPDRLEPQLASFLKRHG